MLDQLRFTEELKVMPLGAGFFDSFLPPSFIMPSLVVALHLLIGQELLFGLGPQFLPVFRSGNSRSTPGQVGVSASLNLGTGGPR